MQHHRETQPSTIAQHDVFGVVERQEFETLERWVKEEADQASMNHIQNLDTTYVLGQSKVVGRNNI
jgi:hypothetical protein